MPVLGIITCEMFEDEIVELAKADKDISCVFLVESECGARLYDKLKAGGVQVVSGKLGDLSMGEDEFVVVVEIKELALHDKPEVLKKEVLDSINLMQDHVDAVLLFYGLCGNALRKIYQLTETVKVPVLILTDDAGDIVDDCIGASVGGTDRYLQLLKQYPGTFFLTPMWAEHWREMFQKVHIVRDPWDIKGCKYVFDCVGYRNAMKIAMNMGDEEAFERNVKEFEKLFDFGRLNIEGSTDIAHSNYLKAKALAMQESGRKGATRPTKKPD